MTQEAMFTVREASTFLKVKPETIRMWLRDGRLEGHNPGGRRWLIPRRALEALGMSFDHAAPEEELT